MTGAAEAAPSLRTSKTGRMPRIAILFSAPTGDVDGIRDYCAKLADALCATGGVEAFAYLCPPGRLRASLRARTDDLDDVDAVVLQYNPFSYGPRGFAPWLPAAVWRLRLTANRPTVALMVHEPYVPMRSVRSTIMGAWQRLQLRALWLAADVRMTSIEAWSSAFSRIAPRGPVHHLAVGSNLPDMRLCRSAERRSLGVDDETFVVSTFGTGHPSQMMGYVGRAVTALHRAGHSLLVLNLGANAPRIGGIDPAVRVETPGYLPANSVARRLAASDLFMAPFVDGVSTRRTTLMAALQHGLPVLGTDGPLTDNVLRAATSALTLVPADRCDMFAEAARQLAVQPERLLMLGQGARALYESSFQWPVLAGKLLDALDSTPAG
jgi:glycosyltransferase involved in cell wall biosynthesis